MKVKSIPKPGDTGEDVKTLQTALKAAGFGPGPVDGVFGSKTKQACSRFQLYHGLRGSGTPGPDTMALLKIEVSPVTTPKPVEPPPKVEPAKPEVKAPVESKLSRQLVADKIAAIIQKDVDDKLRETEGKNRSPRIDEFNKRLGAKLGAPYCASGIWCAIDDACKELGLKNPMKKTASSQAFRKDRYVPKQYMRASGELGQKGDVGVLQNVDDENHGHLTFVREDMEAKPFFKTSEYNTDAIKFDRDGDGAYNLERSIQSRSSKNAGKLFICFTDISQWVVDYNS